MHKKILIVVLAAVLLVSVSFVGAGCKTAAPKKDVTLHMLMEDIPATHAVEDLLPEFTKATGIKVEFEIVQYMDMHQKLVTNFMSKTGQYDVIEVDNYWAGEFPAAGWIIPLDDYIKKDKIDTSVYIPAMMNMVGYFPMTGTEKKVYMLPIYSYSMGLIYRTDLLNDPKLQESYKKLYNTDLKVPATLDEYVQQCKFMQENAGVNGSAMQAGRGDPIVMEWSNYLFALGGSFYDENWNSTINDAKALKAVELYKANITSGSPKGALSFALDDALRIMSQGEAYSMISYIIMLPLLKDPAQSKIADSVEMVPMPGGNGLAGGWGWSIAANSQYKDESWEFIKWVESYDIAKKRALKDSTPARLDISKDADVIKKYPIYPVMSDVIAHSVPVPEFQYSAQMVEIVGRELSLICSGEKDAQAGLDLAKTQLDELAVKAKLKK
jgi:ABC-type glycerol-3-phosphate transport system substrate-binding protein